MALILVFIILFICVLLAFKLLYRKRPKSLKNRHIIVTGGSSGIGKSVALECVNLGAKVTIVARNEQRLIKAKDEILSSSKAATTDSVQYVSVDLSSNYDEVEMAVKVAERSFGPTYMLVNCAGMAVCGKLEDMTIENIKLMMDINYYATVFPIKAVLTDMKSRKEGIIIITSSMSGLIGLFGYGAYSASKFALRGLAECLAMECQQHNVKVTLCLPPDTDTPGFENENRTKPLETKLLSEAGGLVQPHSVAKQLISDALKGEFFSTIGIEGLLLGIVCSGAAPNFSSILLPLQVFLMGPIRFFMWCMHLHFKAIMNKCAAKRDSDKKHS